MLSLEQHAAVYSFQSMEFRSAAIPFIFALLIYSYWNRSPQHCLTTSEWLMYPRDPSPAESKTRPRSLSSQNWPSAKNTPWLDRVGQPTALLFRSLLEVRSILDMVYSDWRPRCQIYTPRPLRTHA